MKKTLFVISLFVAVVLLGCDGPNNTTSAKEEPPTLDQRLIGGRWYYPQNYGSPNSVSPRTSSGYYKFVDGNLIYSNETDYYKIMNPYELDLSNSPAYSKDGVVQWKDPPYKAMQFSFHSMFPFKDGDIGDDTTFPTVSGQRFTLNKLASKGDLITYRLYNKDGSIFNDGRIGSLWFLVRFKDDGSPYRDYDD